MQKLKDLISKAEADILDLQGEIDRQKMLYDVSRLMDRKGVLKARVEALNEAMELWRNELGRGADDGELNQRS
jgi:hypothetical protein